jgi:chemotaxis protein methyltransferase CheR
MKASTLSDAYLHALASLIRDKTGLVFPRSRQHDLEAGIHRAMTNSGAVDLDEFARLLETDERLFDTLISDITVAETYFFREPAQFEVIRKEVLPDLRRHQSSDAQVRIWSAGCASGEEAYSLAILMEQEGLAAQSSILATDISRASLARGREAVYGAWSLRDRVDGDLVQFFQRHGDRFSLHDRLRRRVDFKYLNLAANGYPSPITGTTDIDLIVCRNVLIYFDRETVRLVARRLFESLRVGGWLITGPSDPPLWDCAPFRTIVTSAGVLYRRGEEQHLREFQPVPAPRWPAVDQHAMDRETRVQPPPARQSSSVELPADSDTMPSMVGLDAQPRPGTDRVADSAAYIAEVRALADRGEALRAEARATAALHLYPLCAELHYLHAMVFMELGRYDEAILSLRRVIYLDPSLAMAHFALGSILDRRGATGEAERAFQNALTLCLRRPKDEILPLTDDESTMSLIDATRAQLARIGDSKGALR